MPILHGFGSLDQLYTMLQQVPHFRICHAVIVVSVISHLWVCYRYHRCCWKCFGLTGVTEQQLGKSRRPARSRFPVRKTRPKIGRLAPATVISIDAYGCVFHPSSSTNFRQPRPSRLTEAPVPNKPFIWIPATFTSANTRGSRQSSRFTA
ncbi:uncharacterized protein [Drosophila virilis]|uniref:uncharacterized protein n=1 Tax=Drosophila virilis TaxID=7244 RepID=UPI0038B2BA29